MKAKGLMSVLQVQIVDALLNLEVTTPGLSPGLWIVPRPVISPRSSPGLAEAIRRK